MASDGPALHAPPLRRVTDSIPEGKVIDFLTGEQVNDTAEEYVRQNVERDLVKRYGYRVEDCAPEVRLRIGSSTKRIDVAVFAQGAEHSQENIRIVVECKKPGTHPHNRRDGIDQCKSYMAACVNATYGMWTNGDDRYLFAKRSRRGGYEFDEIVELPSHGQSEEDAQRPHRRDLRPATADNLMFAFRRCHNYIAGTEGMHKTEAFWELLKIVFCKVEDERSRTLDFYVSPAERSSATSGRSAKERLEAVFEGTVAFGAVGRWEGRLGQPVLVTRDRGDWLASNDVMRLRARSGVIPGSLWLALCAETTQVQIAAMPYGSVIDHTGPDDIENRVWLPPVDDDLGKQAEAAWDRFRRGRVRQAEAIDLVDAVVHAGL